MSLYLVKMWATQANSTLPGYAQMLCVHDAETDNYLGEWRGVDEQGHLHSQYPYHAQEEEVWAKCVFSAMRKFREWQRNGKDRDWLMKGTETP